MRAVRITNLEPLQQQLQRKWNMYFFWAIKNSQFLARESESHGDGDQGSGNAAKERGGPLDAHVLEHLSREEREACCYQ